MEPRTVVLKAVGDVGFVGSIMERVRRAPEEPFSKELGCELSKGDIVFGNLEIPMMRVGYQTRNTVIPQSLVSTADAAGQLKMAGFHVMNLANNHILDHGPEGLRSSRRLLEALGIRAFGAGESLIDARRPVILDHKGTRVGFLGYTGSQNTWATASSPGAAPMLEDYVDADITAVRRDVDILVLSLHFGIMYTDYPQVSDQERLRRWIDMGVDVILGHHPHVCQGFEPYRDGLIAYSLGEIVFDPRAGNVLSRESLDLRKQSVVLTCRFTDNRLSHFDTAPFETDDDHVPRIATGEAAASIIRRLQRLSEPLAGDGLRSVRVMEEAGVRLAAHEIRVLLFHLRRLNFAYLAGKLARIRWRHIRMAAGFLRRRMLPNRR